MNPKEAQAALGICTEVGCVISVLDKRKGRKGKAHSQLLMGAWCSVFHMGKDQSIELLGVLKD